MNTKIIFIIIAITLIVISGCSKQSTKTTKTPTVTGQDTSLDTNFNDIDDK